MDKARISYRKAQLKKIDTGHEEFKTKIKFIGTHDATNWLDIENEELKSIINLLTEIPTTARQG